MSPLIIKNYQVVDHGIEHPQYFQGCSSDDFDYVVTGVGNNSEEAINVCIGEIAEQGFDIKILKHVGEELTPDVRDEDLDDFYYFVSIRWN